jgi:hypothetical protein
LDIRITIESYIIIPSNNFVAEHRGKKQPDDKRESYANQNPRQLGERLNNRSGVSLAITSAEIVFVETSIARSDLDFVFGFRLAIDQSSHS